MEYLEKEILDIKKILELNNLLFNKEIQSSILKGNDESKFIYDCIGKKNIMFKLIYKMTKDGNDKKYFHEKCDKKGATLCLFKIKNKDIRYGGFTSVSWDCESSKKKMKMLSFFQLIIKKCLKQQILKDQFIVVVNMGLFLEEIVVVIMNCGFMSQIIEALLIIKYIQIKNVLKDSILLD